MGDESKKVWKISLLSTAIGIAIIEPVLHFGGNILANAGGATFEWISNQIYRRAAAGLTEQYAFHLWMWSIGALIGLYMGLTLRSIRRANQAKGVSEHDLWWDRYRRAFEMPWIALITLSVFVIAVFALSLETASRQAVLRFNQRMTAAAPILTEDEEERLRSDWVLMRTEQDWKRLNVVIEQAAIRGGMKDLPPR